MSTGRLSIEARRIMGRSALAEEKLAQLVAHLGFDEQRAFWLGVLIRDGAVTVDEALANLTRTVPSAPAAAPPPGPIRYCTECGAEIPWTHRGRPRTICDRLDCRRARQHRSQRAYRAAHRAAPGVPQASAPPETGAR